MIVLFHGHRRHALVRPAVVRRLRRNAQACRRARRNDRSCGRRRRRRPQQRARNGPADSHSRWASGIFGPPPSNARPARTGFTGRATSEHPAGFYGPPEGPFGGGTPWHRPTGLRHSIFRAQCTQGGLSYERTARPARASTARRIGTSALDAWLCSGLQAALNACCAAGPRPAAAVIALAVLGSTLFAWNNRKDRRRHGRNKRTKN